MHVFVPLSKQIYAHVVGKKIRAEIWSSPDLFQSRQLNEEPWNMEQLGICGVQSRVTHCYHLL